MYDKEKIGNTWGLTHFTMILGFIRMLVYPGLEVGQVSTVHMLGKSLDHNKHKYSKYFSKVKISDVALASHMAQWQTGL